jgi:PAS domain S-box-containing protein
MAAPVHTPAVLLSAVVGMGVALLASLQRDKPGAVPLTVFMAAASLWALSEGLQLASPGYGAKLFWLKGVLTISPALPVAWFTIVVVYTGREEWLSPRNLFLLTLEPAVFVALVWTNPAALVVDLSETTLVPYGSAVVLAETFGIAMWAHVAYSYVLVTVGGVLLVQLILRTNDLFRNQGTALLVAIFFPLVGNALTLFDVLPPGLELTSIAFVGSGLVLTGALFRQELFELAPITRDLGREEFIDDLDDAVVIVDENGRIVDSNHAAVTLFDSDGGSVVGQSLDGVLPQLARTPADDDRDRSEIELEHNGRVRYYDVQISELYRGYGALTGRLISLRDVTERRQREQRLDVLYRLLRHNLRNEMNVVRGNAELLDRELDGGHGDRIERIESTVDRVVERSEKIGRLSRALDGEGTASMDLGEHLDDIAAPVEMRYPDADVTVDVPATVPPVVGGSALSIAFEELLTNAIEHNDRPASVHVTADVADDDSRVIVSVADDGPGIAEHERAVILERRETPLEHGSGIGLWLVAWVVRKFGGTIEFDVEDGTTVSVYLPRADAADAEA